MSNSCRVRSLCCVAPVLSVRRDVRNHYDTKVRLLNASALACLLGIWANPLIAATDETFFETEVRPVLVEHCHSCHGPKKQEAGLRLDSRQAILKGGDNGPVIVLGRPDESLMIQAVHHTGDLKMPPEGKLNDRNIAALTNWVERGASWPVESSSNSLNLAAIWKNHWAFQPITIPSLPNVRNPDWVRTAVDRFILAKLEKQSVSVPNS